MHGSLPPKAPPLDAGARRRALAFLRNGPLQRRAGGWRFGTARIADSVVDRLLAEGSAIRDGDRVYLAEIRK